MTRSRVRIKFCFANYSTDRMTNKSYYIQQQQDKRSHSLLAATLRAVQRLPHRPPANYVKRFMCSHSLPKLLH